MTRSVDDTGVSGSVEEPTKDNDPKGKGLSKGLP